MILYRIDMTPDDDGTLLVTCPALPEVTTFGADEDAARRHAAAAIEEALAARIAGGARIPPADRQGTLVSLSLMTTLKVGLYQALQSSGLTRAELMRRLGWKRESVDRLFRLDRASRLDQLEAAYRALGRSIDIRIGKAA